MGYAVVVFASSDGGVDNVPDPRLDGHIDNELFDFGFVFNERVVEKEGIDASKSVFQAFFGGIDGFYHSQIRGILGKFQGRIGRCISGKCFYVKVLPGPVYLHFINLSKTFDDLFPLIASRGTYCYGYHSVCVLV